MFSTGSDGEEVLLVSDSSTNEERFVGHRMHSGCCHQATRDGDPQLNVSGQEVDVFLRSLELARIVLVVVGQGAVQVASAVHVQADVLADVRCVVSLKTLIIRLRRARWQVPQEEDKGTNN